MRPSLEMTCWIAAAVTMATAPGIASAADQCVPSRAMIVLDKSSSMTAQIGGQSKWQIATTALDHVATMFQNKIDLGLMMFPNAGECSAGRVNVDVGAGQRDAIVTALGTPPPASGNWTPMSETLDAAASVPSLLDPLRRRYVILITDGWQWCYPYDASTRSAPVASVEALRAAGITTYVVGFGDSVDVLTLNQMATAAGTAHMGCDPAGDAPGAANPCYFQADSPSELSAALEEIGVQLSAETCDGLDNDCDGVVDEDLVRDCATECGVGAETCQAGAWGTCSSPTATTEMCDGVDNDCDGVVDGSVGTPPADAADELCGPGMTCDEGQCVDVDEPVLPPAGEDEGFGNASGCGCRVGKARRGHWPANGSGVLAGLLLLATLAIRRRRG